MALVVVETETTNMKSVTQLARRVGLLAADEISLIVLKEVEANCRMQHEDSPQLAFEKSKVIFDVLKKASNRTASVSFHSTWRLFLDNVPVALDAQPQTCGKVYVNKLFEYVKLFLRDSKVNAFPLIELLQFNELQNWKPVFLSILTLCLENFPEDVDCCEIITELLHEVLTSADYEFKDKIHIVEHFFTSTTIDHRLLHLDLPTALDMHSHFTKLSFQSVVRYYAIMGINNFTKLLVARRNCVCCTVCSYSIHCASAIAFVSLLKADRFQALPGHCKAQAQKLVKSINNRPELPEDCLDISNKFIEWWGRIMDNQSALDDVVQYPAPDFLHGCLYTDSGKVCPLGTNLILDDDGPDLEMTVEPCEWKIMGQLSSALDNDPNLQMRNMQGIFDLTRRFPVAGSSQSSEELPAPPPPPPPQPLPVEEPNNLQLVPVTEPSPGVHNLRRRRRVTFFGKKVRRNQTEQRQSMPSTSAVIDSQLNPALRRPISVKQDYLFR